jgi:tellurite resistance protein
MASRVVLKASDVAAIIGRHQYKARDEVLNDYWKKYSPDTFTGKTKNEKALEALGASESAQNVLKSALAVEAKDSKEAAQIFEKAKDQVNLDPKLSVEQKAEVIEHVRSKVYTTHGTRSEDKTSDKVVKDTGARLVRDDAFYNLDVCTMGQTKFVICGKIDRIEEKDDGSRVLVEIKNRTNRLFRRVVDYEFIQIQVYLQMLGLVHARLVEQYNNQVLSHDVDRNEEMWSNEIMPSLQEFCVDLHARFESQSPNAPLNDLSPS